MKKRRILLALIMLIISGISLTTATYAWFTANSNVKVEEMQLKATASGGIQISANAKDWSDQVSLTDLKAITGNLIPDTSTTVKSLMPVTTIGSQTQGQFDFFLGTLDDAGAQVKLTTENQTTSTNLIAFDLYFYSATPQTLYFNNTTSVSADSANLEYSMRLGFLHQGNDPTATTDTALGLKQGTSASQKIWEPYANKHTNYAINMLGAKDNTPQPYMGGKADTAGAYVATDADAYFSTVTTIQTTDAQAYPDSTLASWSLAAGINKFRIYIWIEGQDVDCEDTASLGTGLKVNLGFTIKDPKTA